MVFKKLPFCPPNYVESLSPLTFWVIVKSWIQILSHSLNISLQVPCTHLYHGRSSWEPLNWIAIRIEWQVARVKGNPLQCSCLENPRDGGAWWLPSMGSHRVGHDWSDLAAAAAHVKYCVLVFFKSFDLLKGQNRSMQIISEMLDFCDKMVPWNVKPGRIS